VPRLLVVSGTLGAGKTHSAEAIADVLAERGEAVGLIDLDWLCQMHPAPADDPYNDRLALDNLAAVWPNYERLGVEYLIVARVVENAEDRGRYEAAVPGAEVRIVRVEASAKTRAARLTAREPEGASRDWHLRRTDVLAARLRELDGDDLVVQNEEVSGLDVALEVVSRLGW
jgi:hypothetical protein